MSWSPTWLLSHPREAWTLDATEAGLDPDAFRALDWRGALDEMAQLEAGAIANGDENRQVGHYWLRAPEMAPTMGQARGIGETVEAVKLFAERVHSGATPAPNGKPFTHLIHIGIGGSALGPRLLVRSLQTESPSGLEVHFLDNTDPDGLERTLIALQPFLSQALVIVATKSGSTPETLNALRHTIEALENAGTEARHHLVGITTPGSRLEQRAKEEGWRAVFHLWDWVGGRFSLTSAVGLLTGALARVDVGRFLDGARDMDAWTRDTDPASNPAALLAGSWYLTGEGRGTRNLVMLPYADRLALLSPYLQQLVMESLGKRLDRQGEVVHQGLTVYGNKGSTDQHSYVQQLRAGPNDFLALFVQVLSTPDVRDLEVAPGTRTGDYLQGFLLGTRRALCDSGRPSLVLTIPEINAYFIGGLVALFERAVGLYAALIDVNAYHQPGVEAGKTAARQMLDAARLLGAALRSRSLDPAQAAGLAGISETEAYYLLERLAATQRARRDGTTYTAP